MGVIINKKIETVDGNQHDSFYMRIEGYWFHKSIGNLQIALNHYKGSSRCCFTSFCRRYNE